jgi:hypothetical protein
MSHVMTAAVLCALAGLSMACDGRTYFVSAHGADGNIGTADAPFRTIARACALAAPGDTVVIRDGDYRETIRPARSGEAGRPITFEGHEGAEVRITEVDTGGDITDRSWLTFRRLSFVDCERHWIWGTNAHHITVEECSFDNSTEDTNRWEGVGCADGSYLTIRRCRFGQWGSAARANGTKPGEVHGAGDMIRGWPCDYTLIEENDFRGARSGHSVIAAHGHYIVIRNNVIQNLWQKGLDIGERMFRGKHVPGSHYLFENNRVSNTRLNYPEAANGGVGLQVYSYDSIYRYNTFASNEVLGVEAGPWGDPDKGHDITPGLDNNRFYNNTFWGHGRGGMVLLSPPVRDKDTSRNAIVNSIFAGNGASPKKPEEMGVQLRMRLRNTADGYGDNWVLGNCFSGPDGNSHAVAIGDVCHDPAWCDASDPEHFGGNIWADPRLADPAREDFSLASDSPCAGAGRDLTQTIGPGDASRDLRLRDAAYLCDGYGLVSADWIRIGETEPVQIQAIDYRLNVVTLVSPRTWRHGDPVNLYRDSSGNVVLRGAYPDIGAAPPR